MAKPKKTPKKQSFVLNPITGRRVVKDGATHQKLKELGFKLRAVSKKKIVRGCGCGGPSIY